jgi:hypothetical protein
LALSLGGRPKQGFYQDHNANRVGRHVLGPKRFDKAYFRADWQHDTFSPRIHARSTREANGQASSGQLETQAVPMPPEKAKRGCCSGDGCQKLRRG